MACGGTWWQGGKYGNVRVARGWHVRGPGSLACGRLGRVGSIEWRRERGRAPIPAARVREGAVWFRLVGAGTWASCSLTGGTARTAILPFWMKGTKRTVASFLPDHRTRQRMEV